MRSIARTYPEDTFFFLTPPEAAGLAGLGQDAGELHGRRPAIRLSCRLEVVGVFLAPRTRGPLYSRAFEWKGFPVAI